MRAAVFERDHGVCALCQADTEALYAEYRKLIPRGTHSLTDGKSPAERFRLQHGVPIGRAIGDWWDADHIVPVIEGGGECKLSNLRTLCIPCHRIETAKLRQRMASANEEARQTKKDETLPTKSGNRRKRKRADISCAPWWWPF
jgi:5-methylcytosine-specific restriction endonuclease McrA